tara:strand:- start:1189 stop:1617 length:429 start_codon:yes stop_codon:yes gene_type:complete
VPKYSREVSSAIREYFSRNAALVRSNFLRDRSTQGKSEIHDVQKRNKFLVKGRIDGGIRKWDVYELDGFKEPRLVGSDFVFQEEAIAFARDRTMGRMTVGYGKIKGMFKVGSGGILKPSSNIDTPGGHRVSVVKTRKGVIVG